MDQYICGGCSTEEANESELKKLKRNFIAELIIRRQSAPLLRRTFLN